jgi:hypothetical protein
MPAGETDNEIQVECVGGELAGGDAVVVGRYRGECGIPASSMEE